MPNLKSQIGVCDMYRRQDLLPLPCFCEGFIAIALFRFCGGLIGVALFVSKKEGLIVIALCRFCEGLIVIPLQITVLDG